MNITIRVTKLEGSTE